MDELQLQLVSFLMILITLHTTFVAMHGVLQGYCAYLLMRRNKRRRVSEDDCQSIRSNSLNQSQSISKKRKANNTDEEALIGSLIELGNNFCALSEGTSQCIQDMGNYFKSQCDDNEYPGKVYEGLVAIEDLGLDESQMVEVGEIIASSPSTAKFFFSLPMDVRKIFVLKKLGIR